MMATIDFHMDKSFFVSKFQNFCSAEAEKRTSVMLSDFQRKHFDRYYANPFPLRKSAVMILLFAKEDRLNTIMIERTDFGKHAGQISFPGGKSEPSDTDSIETAIRETMEEIGIELQRDNIVGTLPPVKVPVSGFEIFPVVAFSDKVGNFTLSENEVRKILEVDLIELRNTFGNKVVTVENKQYKAPGYTCGKSVVWGATAMITAELFYVLGC